MNHRAETAVPDVVHCVDAGVVAVLSAIVDVIDGDKDEFVVVIDHIQFTDFLIHNSHLSIQSILQLLSFSEQVREEVEEKVASTNSK